MGALTQNRLWAAGTALAVFLSAAVLAGSGGVALAQQTPLPGGAPSAQSGGTAPPEIHPILKALMLEDGVTVDYIGRSHGLDGWLVLKTDAKDTIPQFFYTTPQGGIISGVLYDKKGQPVTAGQVSAYKTATGIDVIENDKKRVDAFFKEVEGASGFMAATAKGLPTVYVLIEPTCPACVEYWGQLKEHVDRGFLNVKLIPVGNIEGNRLAGAALLASNAPLQAWLEHVAKGAKFEDYLQTLPRTAEAERAVDANNALRDKYNLRPSPVTVYRDADGDVKVVQDKPQNLMRVLADLPLTTE